MDWDEYGKSDANRGGRDGGAELLLLLGGDRGLARAVEQLAGLRDRRGDGWGRGCAREQNSRGRGGGGRGGKDEEDMENLEKKKEEV